jgi:hypothetical protein
VDDKGESVLIADERDLDTTEDIETRKRGGGGDVTGCNERDLDRTKDIELRLQDAVELVRASAPFTDKGGGGGGLEEGGGTAHEELVQVVTASTPPSDVETERGEGGVTAEKRGVLKISERDIMRERMAEGVFPGNMLVCDRPLSEWRENLKLEEEEEEDEEEAVVEESVDWEKCNILEDVGIVTALLSWVRRMMKEGLMEGTVMDPFSWRLNPQAQAEQRRELASESSWFPPVMQAEILKSQDPLTLCRVN